MNSDPKLVYRGTAVDNATPVRLVVLLYEQLIEDLRRAAVAVTNGDIETRTGELRHALEVLAQLQGRLDMEQGGEVAKNLDKFYDALRARLLAAQFKASADILRQEITNLLAIREAWLEVERATAPPSPAASPAATPPQDTEAPKPSFDWTA
jgi:flagellar protein FliS